MRNPIPNLYVAAANEVRHIGGGFDIIIDCTSEGVVHQWTDRAVHCPPTGSNDHQWTEEDLDMIVGLVEDGLVENQRVLVHCNRGVSRSTTAVAAVLLALGEVRSAHAAVEMAKDPTRQPVGTSMASLTKWWAAKNQPTLF